jgi:hypothetical protein
MARNLVTVSPHMKNLAVLIAAIAALLWPIFAFVTVILFKAEIKRFIGRLRKGKLLGQEVELSEDLSRLNQSTIELTAKVAELPAVAADDGSQSNGQDAITRDLVSELKNSPKAALILLATQIEREARIILASVGLHTGKDYIPLHEAIPLLNKQYGGLPAYVISSLDLFRKVRNKIVHGGNAENEEILQAIDSGVTILNALKSIPRETNYVYAANVPVFRDNACTVPWEAITGVLLQSETPGGMKKFFRIFPTTRKHFIKGKRVAWEWNTGSKYFGPAWYHDPDSGEIKSAWSSSIEFIGRNLDEI